MVYDLSRKAILAALQNDWENALTLNEEVLSIDPTNVDALNRIAKIYFQLGKTKKALEMSKKALECDPLNTIAVKSIEKYAKSKPMVQNDAVINTRTFIEETGKTKLVALTYIGDKATLVNLVGGETLTPVYGKHRVTLNRGDGSYVGKLPDNISARLIHECKNEDVRKRVSICVKCANPKEVQVFIRSESPLFT